MQVWLFDIDGTLIVSGGAGQDAAVLAIEQAFNRPASREGIYFAGRTDRAITMDLFARHQIEATEANWRLFQDAYLYQLRQLLPIRQGRVLEGVRDFLTWLASQPETYVGLLTGNVQAGAELKLRHYELWESFLFGGYGDEHHARSDVARQALADACQHLGRTIASKDLFVVGDTVHDIQCARAIGAQVIAVSTGGVAREELLQADPDLWVEDLTSTEELMGLLALNRVK
jgi:phosphoglycolate phosphatase-like HAD superfamily hydrolase